MLAARLHILMVALYLCLWLAPGSDMSFGRLLSGLASVPGNFVSYLRMSPEEAKEAVDTTVGNWQRARAAGALPMPDALWARINRLHSARG